jgi:uncharacterized protein YqfA (UPF0365 family)
MANRHREVAAEQATRARVAESEAQRAKAEAELHEARADMHERGMADDELDGDGVANDGRTGTEAREERPLPRT